MREMYACINKPHPTTLKYVASNLSVLQTIINHSITRQQDCTNNLCQASSVTTTRRYPHLLLSAAACVMGPQLSIHICCRRRRSAANPPATDAAVDQWDRQTDGGCKQKSGPVLVHVVVVDRTTSSIPHQPILSSH